MVLENHTNKAITCTFLLGSLKKAPDNSPPVYLNVVLRLLLRTCGMHFAYTLVYKAVFSFNMATKTSPLKEICILPILGSQC